MSVRNHFTDVDIPCVSANSAAPSLGANGQALTLTIDIVASGDTISGVSVDWGDGGSAEALPIISAPQYGLAHTYSSAGNFLVKVTTTLTTSGLTQEDWHIIKIS